MLSTLQTTQLLTELNDTKFTRQNHRTRNKIECIGQHVYQVTRGAESVFTYSGTNKMYFKCSYFMLSTLQTTKLLTSLVSLFKVDLRRTYPVALGEPLTTPRFLSVQRQGNVGLSDYWEGETEAPKIMVEKRQIEAQSSPYIVPF
jgi:hypothetical protein